MKWKITGFITFFLIFVMPIFQVAGIGIKSVANDVQSSVENETPLINNGSDLEYAPSSIVSEAVTFDQKMSNAHSVAVKYGNWFDSARNRYVPVKIYYPHKTSSHCPIILFSHGLGGSYERCKYLGTKWAASGFVSLHINHAGCDDSVWKNNIRPMKELREIYPYFVSGRIHANDVRFVIDQLELLAKNDPVWEQMLDMSRIGAAGYDLGGLGTLLLAGQLPLDRGEYLYDSRVKAIIVMSPPVNSSPYAASAIYETVQTPVLFFTGTEDNGIIGTTKAPQRRIPFDHLINADRFLVTYNGADHLVYGGHILPINNRNEKLLQNNIAEVSLIFWKAYLAGDPKMYQYLRKNAIGNLIGHAGTIERKLVPVLVPMTSAEMDKNSSAAIE